MPALKKDNESVYRKEISWQILTRTFQDAIVFTERLGIHYLWIDAFCINQDNFTDWFDEALAMASIFSDACLNLAATASPDGNDGLFLAKNKYLANACTMEATWTGFPKGRYVVFEESAWAKRIEEAVLNRRAWVLQERLLSQRTIHFGSDQVSWECSRLRGSETWPTGMPIEQYDLKIGALAAFESMRQVSHEPAELNSYWLVIVSRYTECHLTKESDKLIALAGLAQIVQHMMKCKASDYAAGLWKPYLLQDLLWRMSSTGERPSTYQAPSWSWASVKGALLWNPSGARKVDSADFACEVKQVAIKLLDSSRPFGPVSGGYIEIAAPMYRVSLGPADLASEPVLQYITINGRQYVHNDTLAEVLDDECVYKQVDTWSQEHSTFFCRFATVLFRGEDSTWVSDGLFLERDNNMKRGVFRRLGWARLFHEEAEEEFDELCMTGNPLTDEEILEHTNHGKYVFRLI